MLERILDEQAVDEQAGVWQTYYDEASGNPYYYNPETDETTWTKPAATVSAE